MNDLSQFEKRGLLLRNKIGKAFVFSPVKDLIMKLEAPDKK